MVASFTSYLLRTSVQSDPPASKGKGKGKGKGKEKQEDDDQIHRALFASRGTDAELAATLEKLKALLDLRSNVETPVDDVPSYAEEFGCDMPFQLPHQQILDDFFDRGSDISVETVVDRAFNQPAIYESAAAAFADEPPPVPRRPAVQDEEAGKSNSDELNADWLLRKSADHLQRETNETLTPEQLSIDLFSILKSDRDDDAIQNALVDLIGYDNFEFVTTLITKRQMIVDRVKSTQENDRQLIKVNQPTPPKEKGRPQYGSQVVVQTDAEKREQRRLQKERKKRHQNNAYDEEDEAAAILGFSSEELRKIREEQLQTAATAPLVVGGGGGTLRPSASAMPVYPHVYNSNSAATSAVYAGFATKYADPPGTVRDDNKDWEEVTIPIPKRAPLRGGERILMLSELDDICKGSFKGYKSLNRVQSIVYPVAYQSNENMLICAPTGAGKTDVAMLTVLRTISQYLQPLPPNTAMNHLKFFVSKDDFKIVYVAPMKALAAEIVRKLGSRLEWLGIQVRELTGDMQLTKAEITATQIIVTTPEKWDVVTRKATGDVELVQKVKLLIVDEVHLLHDDRGAVIETLIARTQRQVERSQAMIRIVGLSATLPNYNDVAEFLGVNPYQGLFFFDSGFRPVPLEQHFLGIKGKAGSMQSSNNLNKACYDKVVDLVRDGHQVMVFVHARKETVKTALYLRNTCVEEGTSEFFSSQRHPRHELLAKDVARSRNKELKELFDSGFAMHHAGMSRADRTLVEKLFSEGLVRVLCCTSTLAWGVNLPAYAVIIKGTQVYSTQKGSFMDLSILDVLQIFGRAGRPQYESHGVGYILTTHDKLTHYVSAITHQHPIESRFIEMLVDNLNAEISLGTVTSVDEAVTWLSYTYLYVRMKKNPLVYGMDIDTVFQDPLLGTRRRDLIIGAAKTLHKTQMIVFDENTGYLTPKDLGRTAANFYVQYQTIQVFNDLMRQRMAEADVLGMISLSKEFEQIKVRENETQELNELMNETCCCKVKGGLENSYGKVNILLQCVISRAQLDDFALVSDASYVAQNSARLIRALFEIALNRCHGPLTAVLLSLSKSIDKRMWSFEHPLSQFDVPREIIMKLEKQPPASQTIAAMRDMSAGELGQLVRNMRYGPTLVKCLEQFPVLALEANIAPITRNVLRITLSITADFVWNERVHGSVQPWWIWVEDAENNDIYHSESFMLHRRNAGETQTLAFTIPIHEPLPPQIFIRAVSDTWIGAETVIAVSFQHMILPEMHARHTDLLDLQPLGINALNDPVLEEICGKRFTHFNPVQTQIFHTLYHTPHNVLVGAPTGSGKTVAAELAMWWAFKSRAKAKVVYIAPMKALVRERVHDWRARLTGPMGIRLVELTGDVTPDLNTIENADLIITTPEKWDGISRNWHTRSYVKDVALVIIDEIHLLGGDRGPILEVIVSRTNYISASTERPIRIVGLSTALANAHDLADWLHIKPVGLYNFRHSVRPVPLEIYIDGFPGKHYCPRMATMNKPTYSAIKTHSPTKPVIVFVSSRRQTRLTAMDLIAYCAMEDNPRRFLHLPEEQLDMVLSQIRDPNLRLALGFGIGLHHAGLTESDRKTVEELFVNLKIQILIATSTLAWGVNFPAHLVVIKGTEFFDAKTRGYVDFPITDVLQMMGRAGRPQFDDSGIARIFVHDVKKNFYKKFLHEPFPVESSLHNCLTDHINAEVAGGTVKTKQDAVDYLTWTYFYRRLAKNPTYYGLEDPSNDGINSYLSKLVEDTLEKLVESFCVQIDEDFYLCPTPLGKICSTYYLSHMTIRTFVNSLRKDVEFSDMLRTMCDASEYDEMPVRHNEDLTNQELEKELPLNVSPLQYDDPHAKCLLLVQARLLRMEKLPVADYITDTTSVMDQAIRVLQAMVDVSADAGYLACSLLVMNVMQCIKQACWIDDSPLLILPHVEKHMLSDIRHKGETIKSLPEMAELSGSDVERIFRNVPGLSANKAREIADTASGYPILDITTQIPNATSDNLLTNKEYELKIQLNRVRRWNRNKDSNKGRASCPRFHKSQQEGWWLVLGETNSDRLVAMRRTNARTIEGGNTSMQISTSLKFVAPERIGRHDWTLYVMSDCYRNLDRVIDVTFHVYENKDQFPFL